MKTNEETSLALLQEVKPLLAAQEDFSNDALFEMLSAFGKEKRIQDRLYYVANPYRSFRKTDDTGRRNGNP